MASRSSVSRRAGNRSRSGAQLASVTVELAIVAPILLFLIGMVFTTGRLISQLAWMSQSAFQAYLIGSEFSESGARLNAMNGRWNKLLAGNMALSATYSGPRAVELPTMEEATTSGVEMITTRVRGSVISLFGYSSSLPLSVTITGPILAPNAPVTDLSVPQNPTPPNQRNCVGALGETSPTSCAVCVNNTNCFCPISGTYEIPCP